jgi:peptidoglycan/xylan/chitin deacetylase (PgdA/CDA1 family)
MYEYGSRVGIWRLFQIFAERDIPITIFGCALALERNPQVAEAITAAGYDVCCHGWRWEEHFGLSEEDERERIARAVESITHTTGERPLGWYCRFGPSENTRRLLVEEGGFLDFENYLKAAFDRLYLEGEERPGIMSIGLHPRITGRPARAHALAAFLDHVIRHDQVWVCRRIDIARHWLGMHPPSP